MSEVVLDVMGEWAVQILLKSGLRRSDADWVSRTLIFAEARGVATHGLMRLPVYVDRIISGGINKDANILIGHDLGALVIVDADDAAGAASGVYCADLAAERARSFGIGCVISFNANHFGASGFYTNRIADAELLGIAVCNTESVMCAPSGGRPVLGTNPLAVAAPLAPHLRPQLDMATTTASQGRLIMARQANRPIPLGWAVDNRGRPTQSPADGLAGALLPSGGPKGFGLAFAIDTILAVSGARISPEVCALQGDPKQAQKLGHAFIAIRVDAAGPLEEYRRRIARLVAAIHDSGVDGQEAAPIAPGEPELARALEINGRIELSGALFDDLSRLAQSANVPLPEFGELTT